MNFVCNCICITHASYNIESPLIAGLHVRNRLFMVYLPFSGPSVKYQEITASPHLKVDCGRCSVPVTCLGLAVLIALMGVAVCLRPLPFVNDWQHRMCPSSIPWPWSWVESDTCTATGMHISVCIL